MYRVGQKKRGHSLWLLIYFYNLLTDFAEILYTSSEIQPEQGHNVLLRISPRMVAPPSKNTDTCQFNIENSYYNEFGCSVRYGAPSC